MSILRNSYVSLACRIIVGAVLVFSAATKLAHPNEFVLIVQSYDVLPSTLAEFVARILPWVELFLGGFVFFGLFARLTLPAAGLMLGFFLALMGVAWAQGKSIDCGCFVGVIAETVGPVTLVRDLVILALVVPAYVGATHRLSLDRWMHSRRAHRLRPMIATVSVLAVAAAFGLVVGGSAGASNPKSGPASVGLPTAIASNSGQPAAGQSQMWRLGPRTARVTVTEFGDFQCPACQAISPVLKQLVTEYNGQVAMVFRHFPLPNHSFAIPAAEAAEAAGEQGKFWEMYDLIFSDQTRLRPQDLRARASYLGLDLRQFDEAISSGRAARNVRADFDVGNRIGIQYTPWIMVNDRVVQPNTYQAIKAAIETALRK